MGMPDLRRAVVITGLVRDAAGFGTYLDGIARLGRRDLRVILSTWEGEMERYPAIAAKLAAMGGEVIAQPQPNLRLPGHMLHQVVALERGLACLDDDVLVLKTRPDICGIMDVVEFCDLVPEPASGGPFRHLVHVVGMFGAHPLYINDIIYAGMAADLRRLCALSFLPGVRYPRLAPEQWFWATAFADADPAIDAYLTVNPGLRFNDAAGHTALRAGLAQAPLFARAIAAMAGLVGRSLSYLHPDPARADTRRGCASFTLDALLWDRVALAGIDHHPTAQVNTWVSQGIWDAVAAGDYAPSPLGDQVRAAMPGTSAPLGRDEGRGLEDAAAGLRAALGLAPGPPPWTLIQTGDPYTTRLESEVNLLRREVDRLQRRLGA